MKVREVRYHFASFAELEWAVNDYRTRYPHHVTLRIQRIPGDKSKARWLIFRYEEVDR